jgi:hypothetical protein
VSVFEKLLRENNLDHKSSRLSTRWLNSTPGIQPATNFTHNHPATLQSQHTIAASSEPTQSPDSRPFFTTEAPKTVSVHQREGHTQIKHLRMLNPQKAQTLFRFSGENEELAVIEIRPQHDEQPGL